ncbi:MAG: 50S ribosomal protein L4 [Armatimonadetes bacterium]|nr:50S ribosomal protein L4 [Armatimonadota bacterium]
MAKKDTSVNELIEKLNVEEVKNSTMHRVVLAEQANKRQGTQSVRTRGEARGGGRKPYKQKKTGRARQGSIRAPHYAHGGMAHAVKPRSYEQKVNKKERRLATKAAFATRVQAGDVIVVDSIHMAAPKTKDAAALLKAAGAEAKRLLVILPQYDEATYKSFRNMRNGNDMKIEVRTAPASVKAGADAVKTQAFSTRDLLIAHKIVVSKDALSAIEEVWA